MSDTNLLDLELDKKIKLSSKTLIHTPTILELDTLKSNDSLREIIETNKKRAASESTYKINLIKQNINNELLRSLFMDKEKIKLLRKLRIVAVNLSNNNLVKFEENRGLGEGEEVAQLLDTTKLSLKNNKISFSSSQTLFPFYPQLIDLDLSGNEICEIPILADSCLNLVKLNLSKNKIKTISENILKLKKLRYLDLSKNKIEKIPKEIYKLKKLEKLIINSNKLTDLPITFGLFGELREIQIKDNKINENILKILNGKGLFSFIEFFRNVIREDERYRKKLFFLQGINHCEWNIFSLSFKNFLTSPRGRRESSTAALSLERARSGSYSPQLSKINRNTFSPSTLPPPSPSHLISPRFSLNPVSSPRSYSSPMAVPGREPLASSTGTPTFRSNSDSNSADVDGDLILISAIPEIIINFLVSPPFPSVYSFVSFLFFLFGIFFLMREFAGLFRG